MWVTSNCVNCLRRNPKRSAMYAYHTGTSASSTARACISSTTKQRSIENSLTTQWIFFQSLSMSSRREDFMDIDMGKKPGDKKYYTANQLKKKCKKKQFQGIHDRFLRDQEFRIRMIENHRDEEVCRRWDAFADEDHTYYLSEEEYFYYKNKWRLHSNKHGSNTMPLRHRSDFKQAFSTLQRLQQVAGEEPHVPTDSPKNKQRAQFILHMVELARLLVVFL